METLPEDQNNSSKSGDTNTTEHSHPEGHQQKQTDVKTRMIYPHAKWPLHPVPELSWPTLDFDGCLGKGAGSKALMWGATLHDFYLYSPAAYGTCIDVSGSRMVAWARHIHSFPEGWADDELSWAAAEPDPIVVPPPDPYKAVLRREGRIRDKTIDYATAERSFLEKNVPSLFKVEDFPSPWPVLPFSYKVPDIRAPLARLPRTLVIHDLCNVLSIHDRLRQYGGDWSRADMDRVHVYRLKTHTGLVPEDERDEPQKPDPNEHLIVREPDESGYIPPALRIVDPQPPRHDHDDVAHLYLDETARLGRGNHSYVWKAELEVPRTQLVKFHICMQCARELVDEEFARQDAAGELTALGRSWLGKGTSPTDESTPSSGCPVHDESESNETSPEPPRLPGREMVRTCVDGCFRLTADPMCPNHQAFLSIYREGLSTDTWSGPVYDAPIPTDRIPWCHPDLGPFCAHVPKREAAPAAAPPLARVGVAAKLSFQGDDHLEREAQNYQSFPRHFFDEWSGYSLVRPIKDPVPLAPVVPQYYGYYVPADESSEGAEYYLSPVLLLEDCGKQVEPVHRMCLDDRLECGSLLFRLFTEHWVHGSVYQRNIVMLPDEEEEEDTYEARFRAASDGRVIAEHRYSNPYLRLAMRSSVMPKHERRFRLIDFGRSKYQGGSDSRNEQQDFYERSLERSQVEQLLQIGTYQRPMDPPCMIFS
ncbi:hypothetical protein FISHEDRAFT_73219 [Fistulina hepatica ATCC 64428]|uniref:Uncharacterized protein n=1 Tax=Fistulina hepatica ATCC 64428 TaxID=1128425 RepID=A0A0D7AG83_9AGAR|nr:hypothetical protein FISHEDRAFT_73219 [Fistulina hepatica ATCC 64428]